MSRLIIIGAGGHGKVAADCAEAMQCFDSIAFLDVDTSRSRVANTWDLLGHANDWCNFNDSDVCWFVAIGNNQIRRRELEQILSTGANVVTLIHPSAVVSPYSQIGLGTLVCANSVINPFTQIGIGCILNTASSIDHDNVIGDFVHIAPGCHLAGDVQVGNGSFLGIATTVIQGLKIGQNVRTGAGSVVVRDIPNDAFALGVPARIKDK